MSSNIVVCSTEGRTNRREVIGGATRPREFDAASNSHRIFEQSSKIQLLPEHIWYIIAQYSNPRDIENARSVNKAIFNSTNTQRFREYFAQNKTIDELIYNKDFDLAYNRIIAEDKQLKYWSKLPKRYKHWIIKDFRDKSGKIYNDIIDQGFIEIAQYYKKIINCEIKFFPKVHLIAQFRRLNLIIDCMPEQFNIALQILQTIPLIPQYYLYVMGSSFNYNFWAKLNPDIEFIKAFNKSGGIINLYFSDYKDKFLILDFIAKKCFHLSKDEKNINYLYADNDSREIINFIFSGDFYIL